jgi:predicted double-glycine peptidase
MANETIENIMRALGRIEGKLETFDESFSEIATVAKDHEIRIRSVEKTQENDKGKVLGVSLAVSTAWAIFLALFKK